MSGIIGALSSYKSGGNAYSLVASVIAANNTSSSINTTGANLIVIVVFGAAPVTPTDSKSNTWTALTAYAAGGTDARIWYCYTPSVGSGHTFTGGAFTGVAVAAFSGAAASPFDQENGANASSVSTIQPGSITPSQANELIIAGIASDSGSGNSFSINGGFTIERQIGGASGVNYGGGIAYLKQGSAAAVNPTWTDATGSSRLIASIASFK